MVGLAGLVALPGQFSCYTSCQGGASLQCVAERIDSVSVIRPALAERLENLAYNKLQVSLHCLDYP
jgi:hypothetical protein